MCLCAFCSGYTVMKFTRHAAVSQARIRFIWRGSCFSRGMFRLRVFRCFLFSNRLFCRIFHLSVYTFGNDILSHMSISLCAFYMCLLWRAVESVCMLSQTPS